MKKKLSVLSLILAAALTLTGCNSANEPSSAAISSMIESAAESAVESAMAEFETSEDDIPDKSPSIVVEEEEEADTTEPAEPVEPDEPDVDDVIAKTAVKTTAATTTAAKTKATTTAATTKPKTTTAAKTTTAKTTSTGNQQSKKLEITNEYMYQSTNLKTNVSYSTYSKCYPIFYNFNKKL